MPRSAMPDIVSEPLSLVPVVVLLLARLPMRFVPLVIDPLPNRHRHAPQLEQSHRITSASSCSPISSSARPDNRHRSQPSRTWLPMLATRLALTICRLALSRRLVRMSARLRRASRCRAGPHSCLGLPHPPPPRTRSPPPRGQLDFGISEDLSACVPVRQTSSAKRRLRVTAKCRPNHHRNHLPSYHPSPPGGPLRDRLLLLLLGAPLLTARPSSANMAVAYSRRLACKLHVPYARQSAC